LHVCPSLYSDSPSRIAPLSHFLSFLHRPLPHRHLRSFPTRRSSDLSVPLAAGSAIAVGDLEGYVHFLARDSGAFVARIAGEEMRSEEHTSELQSRFDLVCRLLLEKKKKKKLENLQIIGKLLEDPGNY